METLTPSIGGPSTVWNLRNQSRKATFQFIHDAWMEHPVLFLPRSADVADNT